MGAAGTSAFGAQTASAQANNSAVVESTSSIQSDEIGNIIDVDGMEFVWEGRQLQSIGANGTPFFSYEYNIDGQRTKKTVTDFDTGETTTTEYFYNSGMLMGQKTGNDVLVFMYDESGDMFGFTYNGTPYYYVKNAQNDVWAVTNADGQAVVLYFYDAWGDVAKRYVADGYDTIAQINPILYRSYYCDLELGFYYLNTRYYAPTLHRFLCADASLQTGQGILDKNMFAYCANNPVLYADEDGQSYTITISAQGPPNPVVSGADEYDIDLDLFYDDENEIYTVTATATPRVSWTETARISIPGNTQTTLIDTLVGMVTEFNVNKLASCLVSSSLRTANTVASLFGPGAMISFLSDIRWDIDKYGANPNSCLKAIAVSAGVAAMGVGVAALISSVGVPMVATIGVGIVAGVAGSLFGDWAKRRWIGY